MTTTMDKDTVGKALGKVASGLYILTTGNAEQKQGRLVSWVMQASFEPPRLTVGIRNDGDFLETLKTNGSFMINVLSKNNGDLMGRFSTAKPDQFDDLPLEETAQGPILNATIAYLQCTYKDAWDAGDHTIVLGEVVNGNLLNPDDEQWLHVRKNGFSY